MSALSKARRALDAATRALPRDLDVEAFMRRFDQFDARLVAAGLPATSPWWRAQIEAFLRSGESRWIIRAGRRAGKSTTLSRLAVIWALAGPWSIALGDTPTVAILSVDREEASRRLETIATILRALGVKHTRAGESIEIDARKVVFRVETRSKNAVGFTSIMVLADECSRWESREDKADPASEVIGSIAPTLAGMRHCFMVLASSPWSEVDYHADAFSAAHDQPGTGRGFASLAATWIARPDMSEEYTHTLEPDERKWAREYAAIPGTTLSGAFEARDVNRAFDLAAVFENEVRVDGVVLCIDASSMRPGSDTFAIAVVRVGTITAGEHAGEIAYHVAEVHAVPEGATWIGALQRVEEIAREHGARVVFFDQHQDRALETDLPKLGLTVHRIAWNAQNKPQAVTTLRRLLRETRLAFPAEGATGRDRLRVELLTLKSKLYANGTERVETNGIDFASSVLLLAAAIDAALVAGGGNSMPPWGDSGASALLALGLGAAPHVINEGAIDDLVHAANEATPDPDLEKSEYQPNAYGIRRLTPREQAAERHAAQMRQLRDEMDRWDSPFDVAYGRRRG